MHDVSYMLVSYDGIRCMVAFVAKYWVVIVLAGIILYELLMDI
jgi:hypothetical protein